jgi:hypothetical protein
LITKEKVGRNDPCPCGSGKKFKRCHLGREEELSLGGAEDLSVEEMGARIVGLPRVHYGRADEMMAALDLEALTGSAAGVAFVDLKKYTDLNLFGGVHVKAAKGQSGGVFINPFKTAKADPTNLYLAISKDIDDSTLVHELAHVLDYLGGSRLVPGTLAPLSLELTITVEGAFESRTDHHGGTFRAPDVVWALARRSCADVRRSARRGRYSDQIPIPARTTHRGGGHPSQECFHPPGEVRAHSSFSE